MCALVKGFHMSWLLRGSFQKHLMFTPNWLDLEPVSQLISQFRNLDPCKYEFEFCTYTWSNLGFGFLIGGFSFFPLSLFNQQDSLLLSWMSGHSLSSAFFMDWVTFWVPGVCLGRLNTLTSCSTKHIFFYLLLWAMTQVPRFLCLNLNSIWTTSVSVSAFLSGIEFLICFCSLSIPFLIFRRNSDHFVISVCIASLYE